MSKNPVVTPTKPEKSTNTIQLSVDPGICGFSCVVKAYQIERRSVRVKISGSDCKQIQRLSKVLPEEISLKEFFLPLTRNPVYMAAEKAGCHATCALPAAILKAVETALGMALPKSVNISFLTLELERD